MIDGGLITLESVEELKQALIQALKITNPKMTLDQIYKYNVIELMNQNVSNDPPNFLTQRFF
jgi:hypothetical protein